MPFRVLSAWALLFVLIIEPAFATASPPVLAGPPAAPKPIPTPEELSVAEQGLLAELGGKMGKAPSPANALKHLDELLARLSEPNKLRGLVQLFRAGALQAGEQYAAATDAIEESVRLLPGYSGPLIGAAKIHAYANRPGQAADYLLRASEVDPATVAKIDDYEIDNIMRRLRVARDERRLAALGDRLLAVGWVGSSLVSRSRLAFETIKRRTQDGDVAAARALIPKLLVPSQFYALLANNAYRDLWPDLEKWAGPRLERQWATYLDEARSRWRAGRNEQTTRDYAAALSSAGHDRTIIRDILPVFSGKLDPIRDHELLFVVPTVAGALARDGRWADVDTLFVRATLLWPPRSSANAINISANWARYRLLAGRFDDALTRLDMAIAEGRRWQVNPDALAGMYHARACTLAALGRSSEAAAAAIMAAGVEFPGAAAGLQLCLGNRDAARRALIEGLKVAAHRDNVISYVQKTDERSVPSDYARRAQDAARELAADPAVVAEVLKYGRILPFAWNEAAPKETP